MPEKCWWNHSERERVSRFDIYPGAACSTSLEGCDGLIPWESGQGAVSGDMYLPGDRTHGAKAEKLGLGGTEISEV